MPRFVRCFPMIASALLPATGMVARAAEPVAAPSFREDVMAAISKAGCNLGTCHGNATGKGGFKLSLRGQDPDFDFQALSRDMSGRRVDMFVPENSLLLQKGLNKLAHEGGKRLDAKGWEYGVLRDWIAAGMPRGTDKEPVLVRLEVTPVEPILNEPQSEVQIRASAVFSDGTRRDVTQRAVYEPLQVGLVDVGHDGLVRRRQFGEPTVLVRYLNQSAPVRLTFVAARPGFEWKHPRPENYVDRQVFAKLKTLRMNPSAACSDEVFVRRAYLDLLGGIPSADDAIAFVQDTALDKRARLVDRLLARPEFADFWAMKWSDVLKVEGRTLDKTGMTAFHRWIRNAIAQNRPMNLFVRDILAGRGSTYHEPETNFYRANRTPEERAVTAAQVFLGTRLQCAQCHNHPFDRWTQDDYYNWAAVFGQIDYKILDNKRSDKNDKHEFNGEQVVFLNPKLKVENPRTGDSASPRFLGADAAALDTGKDELQAAGDWVASRSNPLFAKAQVNRIWYHLMGRGLVDPVDDFRITNPASHPQLLEDLAADFERSGFDLRHMIRVVMLSRTYQLDSTPNETNADDEANYSHVVPRRLGAEQLLDSLHGALRIPVNWTGRDTGLRAVALAGPPGGRGSPDPASPEAFLADFGRPKRQLACECERASDTSLGQVFQLIGGPVANRAITARDNLLRSLSRSELPVDDALRRLYWALLSRAPTSAEASVMEARLASAQDRRAGLEDIAWALINAKEFVLRR